MMRPGTILGERYRLSEEIGSGPTGTVWLGHDTVVDRPVTVKVLHTQLSRDESIRQRFRRTALEIATLTVTGVIDVYDCLEEPDDDGELIVCQVTELVNGRPLSEVLAQEGTWDEETVLSVTAAVAMALHGTHDANVIHGALKPENLIVDGDGAVTIVDFGFQSPDGEEPPGPYAAPESRRGTVAGDIYALGAIAHQCLTGAPPPAAIAWQSPELDESVPAPIQRALARFPKRRFSNAAAFATACRDYDPETEHGPETAVAAVPATEPEPETEPANTADTPAADDEPATAADNTADDTVKSAAAAGPAGETGASPTGSSHDPEPTAEAPEPDADADTTPVAAADDAPQDAADPDPAEDLAATEKKRRTRLAVVLGLVALLIVAAIGIHLATPSKPTGHSAGPDRSSESSSSSQPSSSPAPSGSTGGQTPNSPDPAPTTQEPSSSASTPGNGHAEVPNVTGKQSDIASGQLSGAGFNVNVDRQGGGRFECPVESQFPGAGSIEPQGSTVTITVRRAHTTEECPQHPGPFN